MRYMQMQHLTKDSGHVRSFETLAIMHVTEGDLDALQMLN